MDALETGRRVVRVVRAYRESEGQEPVARVGYVLSRVAGSDGSTLAEVPAIREAPMFPIGRHDTHVLRIGGPGMMLFLLMESMFWALAATCVLAALHRIASGAKTRARIEALKTMGDAYTDEQREVLIRRIKVRTLSPF